MKKFLIFLFAFGFLLKISPAVLALDINGVSLISPTPTPTPTPEPTTLPFTNVWQLIIIGLAVAIIWGLIFVFILNLKKGDKSGKRKKK